MPIDNRDSVCSDCARKMGWKPKNKVVGVWQGKCDFCGKTTGLTSLHHDWYKAVKQKSKASVTLRIENENLARLDGVPIPERLLIEAMHYLSQGVTDFRIMVDGWEIIGDSKLGEGAK